VAFFFSGSSHLTA